MSFDPKQFMLKAATDDLRPFMSRAQLSTIRSLAKGEEGDWFVARMVELAALIATMPKTYEQDGKGDQATAYLHYFRGNQDWYITERDIDQDGEGQIQAFGLANLGYGGELGYISIAEVIKAGVELDLHFKPTTLAAINAKGAA